MLPLVSVIVPVYNVEKYLNQCVESLIVQTYKNIEILLIDDGSKDASGAMCDALAKKYANVYTYHKSNSGLGLTRNYGLEKTRGEYVTFVDSDDYLRKDAIQNLVTGLDNGKNDTVLGGFTKVTDEGKELYVESYSQEIVDNGKVYSHLFNRMLGSSPTKHDSLKPSVWNALYSNKIIQKNKLEFTSERKLISEDIVWDSDYYKYAKSVKVIDSPAYYYRFNPSSLSLSYRPDRFRRSIDFYQYMIDKMSTTDFADEARLRQTRNLFVAVRTCFSQGLNRPFGQIKQEISQICSDSILQKSIENYPIDQLEFKQRIFIEMVKNKNAFLLTILAKAHVM